MSRRDLPESDHKTTLFLLVGFFSGIIVSIIFAVLFSYTQTKSTIKKSWRESNVPTATAYKFTDPLLGISLLQVDSPEYGDLQNGIDSYIAKQKNNTNLVSASVYVRDIMNAEGFQINPQRTYPSGSLMKVPLMMAYYSLAQKDPETLSQQIYYSGEQDLDAGEEIKSPVQLTPGSKYSVEQLIEHMIQYSDNNAMDLLFKNLSSTHHHNALTDLFANLGVDLNLIDKTDVQSYSVFLRVLYNATYLDRDYSEKALSLLTRTDFTRGIKEGVPNRVTVAEKFGETKLVDTNGQIKAAVLHNCGIIYYPKHPYLLCVMTVGHANKDLETVIKNISQMTFKEMEKRYPF